MQILFINLTCLHLDGYRCLSEKDFVENKVIAYPYPRSHSVAIVANSVYADPGDYEVSLTIDTKCPIYWNGTYEGAKKLTLNNGLNTIRLSFDNPQESFTLGIFSSYSISSMPITVKHLRIKCLTNNKPNNQQLLVKKSPKISPPLIVIPIRKSIREKCILLLIDCPKSVSGLLALQIERLLKIWGTTDNIVTIYLSQSDISQTISDINPRLILILEPEQTNDDLSKTIETILDKFPTARKEHIITMPSDDTRFIRVSIGVDLSSYHYFPPNNTPKLCIGWFGSSKLFDLFSKISWIETVRYENDATNFFSPEYRSKFYQRIDVIASDNISQSYAILEAMVCGRPWISIENDLVREITNLSSHTGFVVKYLTDFIPSFRRLHGDRTLLSEMGKHCSLTASTDFDWSKRLENIRSLI